jgi:catechol 2,3-dioxygenase-like lactoylglutathione lyase family enzyme
MIDKARVATRLPTRDLDRARGFYAEKLGLEPTEERPGGLLYRVAGGEFALYASAGTAPGTFTQMAFEVDDLDMNAAAAPPCCFSGYETPPLSVHRSVRTQPVVVG